MLRDEVISVYSKYGIDVNEAIERLSNVKISIHCWQLDDVLGFEGKELTGGIKATGNYPGRARNFSELASDLDMALKFIPGKNKINLHSIYGINKNNKDRADYNYKEFIPWIEYAKKRGLGLDFNPTLFSSPMVKNGLTLSSPDKEVRDYWIKLCKNSRKISEYFGKTLGIKSLCNIWIPDGLKDIPGNRLILRKHLKDSLDEIYSVICDKDYMDDSLESKLFGLGLESYTTGSHEFYLSYAMKNDCLCLLDTGHFHPTENVSDKISSIMLFSDKIALHVSRGVRWDSDHVLIYNDDLKEIASELVKCNALDKTYIGLDYFDASINRIIALIIGTRNMQKAILNALLMPNTLLEKLQNESNFTELFTLQEELKNLPFNEVYEEYLLKNNIKLEFLEEIKEYEERVTLKRL